MLEHVQYSSRPAPVTRHIHPDGTAEFRLTKNLIVYTDGENNTIIEADEVYFEVPPTATIPTVPDVEASFDTYWDYGVNWPVINPEPTPEEELRAIIEAQGQQIDMLTECLLEMSEIVYGE